MKIYIFLLIIALVSCGDSVNLKDLKVVGKDFDDIGNFIVETAEDKITGKLYKILSFYHQTESQLIKLSNQLSIFQSLSDKGLKNTLKVYSLIENKSKSWFPFLNVILGKNPSYQLVTEYYFYNYTQLVQKGLNRSKNASILVLTLLKALKNLHKAGFAYFNLNPSTIVATEDSPVKFFNFSEAEKIHKTSFFKGIKGDLNYASPEMLTDQEYTEKADLWAFGLVALKIFSGRELSFTSKSRIIDSLVLGDGIKQLSELKFTAISGRKADFWRKILFERCLVAEDSRASAAEILAEYYEMTSGYFENEDETVE